MSYFNNKSIDEQIKATKNQQRIENENFKSVGRCKYAFGHDLCTSGSKRSDYCTSDNPDTCPYNK